MEAQNARCLEVMEKKDAVIAQLRQELEDADLEFVNDQKHQNEDIDLLINRMDNQVRYTYAFDNTNITWCVCVCVCVY